MNTTEAISKSPKRTAFRKVQVGNKTETYVRYKDGSMFKLVASGGKVNYSLSANVIGEKLKEQELLDDWQPSV